jgi:hypothetical protein
LIFETFQIASLLSRNLKSKSESLFLRLKIDLLLRNGKSKSLRSILEERDSISKCLNGFSYLQRVKYSKEERRSQLLIIHSLLK